MLPANDPLEPLLFTIVVDCNCFDALADTRVVAVKPESVKLANVGELLVVIPCMVFNVIEWAPLVTVRLDDPEIGLVDQYPSLVPPINNQPS